MYTELQRHGNELRTGLTCFILASSRRVWSSLRRSFLFPTRMMGTLGQKCFTSGVHFSGMFSATSTRGTSWTWSRCKQNVCETKEERRKSHPSCRGCPRRNTWGWHQCRGRRGASAGRSPPDPPCPRGPAPPATPLHYCQGNHCEGRGQGIYQSTKAALVVYILICCVV